MSNSFPSLSCLAARLSRTLLAASLLFASHAVFSQTNFEEDFDDENKPWEEIAVQMPPAPKQEDLIEFYVSPTATQKFQLDAKSLSIGSDGVIRYTLVATSTSGAKNISYEGIRCETFERKLYAFGRDDGSWGRSRRDQWEGIVRGRANNQHAILSRDYFCSNLMIMGPEKNILQRLRSKQTLTDNLLRE
ncbi:MAG: CNP1-like family protein [Oxalicibacterium faecigallinarum]|uniref:CNP1-like family protein n=1 Tax=Oxalicibacterium faecigallinarum TaxID=573741 RepID=UPI00280A2B3A|nr:CNP1-like family protein [Oxalicibacterium faecigallinarum]MDQ7969780.1 CNP1-like family protein [Oxalicibacterium faecigallinarum]